MVLNLLFEVDFAYVWGTRTGRGDGEQWGKTPMETDDEGEI